MKRTCIYYSANQCDGLSGRNSLRREELTAPGLSALHGGRVEHTHHSNREKRDVRRARSGLLKVPGTFAVTSFSLTRSAPADKRGGWFSLIPNYLFYPIKLTIKISHYKTWAWRAALGNAWIWDGHTAVAVAVIVLTETKDVLVERSSSLVMCFLTYMSSMLSPHLHQHPHSQHVKAGPWLCCKLLWRCMRYNI